MNMVLGADSACLLVAMTVAACAHSSSSSRASLASCTVAAAGRNPTHSSWPCVMLGVELAVRVYVDVSCDITFRAVCFIC